MIRFVFILLVSLLTNLANTQPQFFVKQWDKRMGGREDDVVCCLQQTKDGGYIIGGSSKSGISGDKTQTVWGGWDYWVVKVDSLGNKQWDKRFGGAAHDYLYALCQANDGGYVLGGVSSSAISGDKTQLSRGGTDFWIVKIDDSGNQKWDKRFGGVLDDNLYALCQTNNGGYLLGGYSNSPISGDKTEDNWDTDYSTDDYWVVKVDSMGNKQWDRRFGGDNEDGISSLEQTNNGGYILGGYSGSGIGGDKTQAGRGFGDYWVVKIDSNGNKEWDVGYGGTGDDEFYTFIQIDDGNFVLSGSSKSDIGGDRTEALKGVVDYWIVKIDSHGNKLWDKNYGALTGAQFQSGVITSDNGFLFCGWSNSLIGFDKTENNLGAFQAWVVKTDSSGTKQWDKTIFTPGSGLYSYAIQTSDGCYAVARIQYGGIGGYKTESNWDTTNLTSDYWVIKFCMDTVTGVDDGGQMIDDGWGMKAYPNPFKSDLAISLQKEGLREATFTITNLIGQTIYRKEETNLAGNYTKMLDLSYLPSGIYFVSVAYEDVVVSKRVVKE